MSNKSNLKEIQDDFVSKLFRAIGRGLRPAVFNKLAKKDPKFGKLVKDLEKSRQKAASIADDWLADKI